MTYAAAQNTIRRLRARHVETVRVNGGLRLNIVLPSGKPRTLKVKL